MKLSKLGNSDLMLSRVGMGTWAIGGGDWGMGWGDQDEKESVLAIIEALEQGINWIDTAHAYGFGVSEEAVSKALREWKADEIIVATKCGVLPQEDGKPRRFISSVTIREEVEGSLRRLGRDWIDLYQIHWPEPAENLAESWETLQELRREGKIRWAGVCNCWKEELDQLDPIEPVTSNQPMYSMLAREIEEEVLPWCGAKGTGLLVYSPMHSGLLTGKVSRKWLDELPDNDWRKHKTDHPVVSHLQTEEGMKAFLDFQEALNSIALANGRTIGQLAVAWALRREEVTSAIVGARRPGQIIETVRAAERNLTDEEESAIAKALLDFEKGKENA
ncbi:MAG TPA: aldo/keto reductase [Opitutae bacterium]|nr:aldo/keto reductase [Opitutae bacterium]|tara:strand:- start:313 stop:1311 length:999 start_codon:yes stop_codon:yes gene_type:complete